MCHLKGLLAPGLSRLIFDSATADGESARSDISVFVEGDFCVIAAERATVSHFPFPAFFDAFNRSNLRLRTGIPMSSII